MDFLANMYVSGLSTGFSDLAIEFQASAAQLTNTISYPVLALGVGNLFWMPTSICFGKRPTIIAALVVFIAGVIWSIKATNINSLVAARVVAAFAGGSIDSLGPAVVAGTNLPDSPYSGNYSLIFSHYHRSLRGTLLCHLHGSLLLRPMRRRPSWTHDSRVPHR
jgi:MFS family permease